jgi:serine/threonine-protein kinase Stk1
MRELHSDIISGLPPEQDSSQPTYFAFAARPDIATAATPPEPLPERLNDRYRLERLLGVGGMSAVYCAHDALRARFGDPQPYVAIKVMNDSHASCPDANALLFSEFALTQHLHHPHVIRLYDYAVDGPSQRGFISMEWLQGAPLDRMIAECPQGTSWVLLQPLALAMLDAVVHAHIHGVVHGDLKPSNLMLGDSGLRLFDFGLAESNDARLLGLPRLQRERIAAWTPGYAALELLEGGVISQASDIYALACVLYELASGQHPYRHCSARQAKTQRLERTLTRPPNLPRACWRALQIALKINPIARRISAQELRAAFSEGNRPRCPRWLRPRHTPPPPTW